ncbi:Uncharacterised protein [Listeria grayi]|uniref:Uncharacterized protein n=1 Tax=Listeria grayi TaxID=1641 RepID=A0A378MHX4_LISGR|nr:Uncharacterised protein [Listeria grayi]
MKNNKLKVYKNNQEICETGNFMIVEGMIVRHTSDQLINIIKEGEILFDDAEFCVRFFIIKQREMLSYWKSGIRLSCNHTRC